MNDWQNKVDVFNLRFTNMTQSELLKNLDRGVLVTPNVDHIVKLQNDHHFYEIYNQADWVVCDSNIVQLGLKFLRCPVKEVIPGSSFFPAFYTFHKNNDNVKVFLLGAATGVADKAKSIINKKVGREIIVGAHSPSFGFEKSNEECLDIVEMINKSGATILVVGVGAPKQEKWIYKYKSHLPDIDIFMALGATIDFEAGNIQRAPKVIQRLYLEWLYRLFKEPRRLWRRYLLDDMPFLILLLKSKIGLYRNPFS